MAWNESAMTKAVNKLLTDVLHGRKLVVTRAVGGTGTVAESELCLLTEIPEPKQTLILLGIEDRSAGKLIKIQVRNTDLEESYLLQQIAVYAQLDGDESDTLLFVMQDRKGVEIPLAEEAPDFLFEIYAAMGISNDANITVQTDQQAALSPAALEARLDAFFVVGNQKPTTGPAIWFDTSIMDRVEEAALQLDEDSNASTVGVEIEGTEYAVTNATI